MSTTKHFSARLAGFVIGGSLLGGMTGCISHEDRHHHARAYAPPPPVYVETRVQDEYVYYPGYQVYYNRPRRQYIYLDGRSWVSRSAPPRVSVDVLLASPSVRLDFHDAPATHHATVVRQYPKHWAPPGPGHGPGDRDDGRGNERRDRR